MKCQSCGRQVFNVVEVPASDDIVVELCGTCTGLFVEGLADRPTSHTRLRLLPIKNPSTGGPPH